MLNNIKKGKISVIIPLYNNEKYIVNCIESVFKQSYNAVEVIIVDDGSTDNGYKLIEDKYKDCNDIILKKQTNQGPSIARNNAMLYATGEWIMFLDSDDELSENALENAILNANDVDLVIGGWNGIYSNHIEYYGPSINKIIGINEIQDLANYLLSNGIIYNSKDVCIPSIEGPVAKLYSNRIIKENNIVFPNDLLYAEDVVFNYFYLQFCEKIKTIDISLYNATRHTDSLSNKQINFMKVYNLFEKAIKNVDTGKWHIEKNLLHRKLIWMITDLENSKKNIVYIKEYVKNNKSQIKLLKEADITNLSKFKTIEYKALMSNYLKLYIVLNIGCFIKSVKNNYKYKKKR